MGEHGFVQPEEEPKDAGGFGDTLVGFGIEAVAHAIARGGGLGIARRVIAQVEGESLSHGAKSASSSGPKR